MNAGVNMEDKKFKSLKCGETTHHIIKNQAFKEGLTIIQFLDVMTKQRIRLYNAQARAKKKRARK